MAVKIVRMEQYVTTGQEAISGVLPMASFTPLFTGPHLRVAKVLVCLAWRCACDGTVDVLVLVIFEMFALRNPAVVGATLVGMHIFTNSFDKVWW